MAGAMHRKMGRNLSILRGMLHRGNKPTFRFARGGADMTLPPLLGYSPPDRPQTLFPRAG